MTIFLAIAITLGRRELPDTPEMVGTDVPVPADVIGSGVPDLP
jgi:pyrimidine operon attenuation protein/uracil phosphoribosyltransferase